MKIRKGIVMAIAAVGLAGVVTSPALAATGRLVLSGADGYQRVVSNPPAGCISTGTGFMQVANRTNVPVSVYDGAVCSGPPLVIAPGADAYVGLRHSLSVPR